MLKNSIDVIIPFRGKDPIRIKNLFCVIDFYKKYLPQANIILIEQKIEEKIEEFDNIEDLVHKHVVIDLNQDLFSRSLLFNVGYNHSSSKYLILSDADCFLEKDLLLNFESLFDTIDKKYVIPYERVHYLGTVQSDFIRSNSIERFIENLDMNDLTKDAEYYCWTFPVGGITIVSSDNFYKVNGFDVNFIGWGGEDEDIFNRFNSSGIGVIRLPRNLFHIRHLWSFEHEKYSKEVMMEKKQMLPKIQLIKHE